MSVLFEPWRLFGRLMIAMFRVTAYTVIYLIQIPVFLLDKRPSEVAEGFGEWGRACVDALSDIVRD